MAYPRIIPHSGGAGVIDAVGDGVDEQRVGRAVWCYGAQSYRPFGTAADFVVVPAQLAVDLPAVGDETAARRLAEQGSCLGITGHRAVFADGPVRGLTALVHGAAGGVGSIATQTAVRDGATVIAVVRDHQIARAHELGADHAFSADHPDLASAIRDVAPDGVHRIAEVDLAAHIDLDAEVLAVGGVISSYFSSVDRPEIPYWKLGFADTTLRLLGSDDFTPSVKAQTAEALTAALVDESLSSAIVTRLPLSEIASAHELVEHGSNGRVIVTLDSCSWSASFQSGSQSWATVRATDRKRCPRGDAFVCGR